MKIPELFTHKKFQAGFGMALVIFLGQFFTNLAQTWNWAMALAAIDWLTVSAPVLTAIGAQGIADFGKEKALVDAAYGMMPGELIKGELWETQSGPDRN